MPITSINPTTGEVLKEFQELSENEVEQKLKKAVDTLKQWKKRSFSERASLLRKVGEILQQVNYEFVCCYLFDTGQRETD